MSNIKKSDIIGPMSWDVIKSFHCNAPVNTLPRTSEIISDYKKHINNLKKKNKTVGEYLKEIFFQNGESFQIEPNPFPYHLENNEHYCIKHYVIWFNEKKNKNIKNIKNIIDKPILFIDKIIKNFLNQNIIQNINHNINQDINSNSSKKNTVNNIEYIYFENSLKNKSVPEIRHLQLFFKIVKSQL